MSDIWTFYTKLRQGLGFGTLMIWQPNDYTGIRLRWVTDRGRLEMALDPQMIEQDEFLGVREQVQDQFWKLYHETPHHEQG